MSNYDFKYLLDDEALKKLMIEFINELAIHKESYVTELLYLKEEDWENEDANSEEFGNYDQADNFMIQLNRKAFSFLSDSLTPIVKSDFNQNLKEEIFKKLLGLVKLRKLPDAEAKKYGSKINVYKLTTVETERLPKAKKLDNMVFIEGGKFEMGSNNWKWSKPVHEVTLTSFYISKYLVTTKEYCEFLNSDASKKIECGSLISIKEDWCKIEYKNGIYIPKLGYEKNPIVMVTWDGAKAYSEWKGGRLPTEAEWEYAARGGNKSHSYQFSGSDDIDEVAWYYKNSGLKEYEERWNWNKIQANGNETHPVGQKKANELGLYDMSGNAWEWCNDWYSKDYYLKSPKNNPQGPIDGECRVLRGGSWYDYEENCRVEYRSYNRTRGDRDNAGFRVVIDV